jgi:hypothetical protein
VCNPDTPDSSAVEEAGGLALAPVEHIQALSLQASATPFKYQSGRPTANHPQHLVTFTSPLMISNGLPFELLLKLVPSDTHTETTVMRFEAGQELPVLGALGRNIKAQICVPAIQAAEEKNRERFGEVFQLYKAKMKSKDISSISVPVSDWQTLSMQASAIVVKATGACTVGLVAPYWIINKTGREIRVRQKGDNDAGPSVLAIPADHQEPCMFSYPVNTVKSSTRARFQIGDSKWSDPVNLNTVGHSGVVTVACDASSQLSMSTRISMATGGLTRIIILEPRFFIENRMARPLICQEAGIASNKVELKSGDLVPFWPTQEPAMLTVRYGS